VSAGARERPLRRVATGALAVALPLGALVFAGATFLRAGETGALAERQAATVAALERRVARLGTRDDKAVDVSAIYLPGDGPELARAELQKLLAEGVDAAGGRLIETQEPGAERASETPDDGRVELRVTFDATNDGLLDVLHGLETRLPLLTIERLEARRLDAGGAEADPEDPTLRASIVVRGYRKTPS
jgi:hypothetical protein